MCVRHNVGAHSSLLASRRAEVRERLWLCQDCILHCFVLTSLCCGYVKLKFLWQNNFAKAPAGKERDILDLDLKKEKGGGEPKEVSAGREAGQENRSWTSTISHMISANKLIICKTSKQFVILVWLCNVGTRLGKITVCPVYELEKAFFFFLNVSYFIVNRLPPVANHSSMIPRGEELTDQFTSK